MTARPERLTREQIDDLIPAFWEVMRLAGMAGSPPPPHMLLFAFSAFTGAFELDSVQFYQIYKAWHLRTPTELDGDMLETINGLIDGNYYMGPSELTHHFSRIAFQQAVQSSFEYWGKRGENEQAGEEPAAEGGEGGEGGEDTSSE